ncbi:oxidoreductase [Litorivita pollutaquae]|uniref:Oxidoreductase n=1 Tax=Litorivita pollutaquae TaxID=2200892 RepID=A0A2V4NE48_9RHOB|nr:nitronate monooxygenase [Litorivita pollutaquae]PYC48543.1 oxidoreductase [Litorivita pollutaquae]
MGEGITTRLTKAFDLRWPVVCAPMGGAAGGALASAVSDAGGLGLIGGGYGDGDWIDAEFARVNAPVGCGMITWRLNAALLDRILAHAPRAVFLSFGDLAPFAPRIHAQNIPLIAQVQDMDAARAAMDAGAQVIVAQGTEAGGHGASRATMTLVPEVADMIAARSPETLLLAAGGIADGRGLAAAMMLGADGAVIGSRFWAAAEALVPGGLHAAALRATGDATLRTRVPDVARGIDWPKPFDIRVMRSDGTEGLHGAPEAMSDADRAAWRDAMAAGDARMATPIVGEAVGLIRDIRPAAQIVEEIGQTAAGLLDGGWSNAAHD